MFSHNGPSSTWQWQYWRECRAGVNSHKFPMYSSGGATLFDRADIHNGSKLCTGGISDDDMRGAAIGWWPAACGIIKARGTVCCLQQPRYLCNETMSPLSQFNFKGWDMLSLPTSEKCVLKWNNFGKTPFHRSPTIHTGLTRSRTSAAFHQLHCWACLTCNSQSNTRTPRIKKQNTGRTFKEFFYSKLSPVWLVIWRGRFTGNLLCVITNLSRLEQFAQNVLCITWCNRHTLNLNVDTRSTKHKQPFNGPLPRTNQGMETAQVTTLKRTQASSP